MPAEATARPAVPTIHLRKSRLSGPRRCSYPTTLSSLRPGGVLDRLDEVARPEAGDEPLQDVRIHGAERGPRPGRHALGKRGQDPALEVQARVQGSDRSPVGSTQVVVADAEHVVLHP